MDASFYKNTGYANLAQKVEQDTINKLLIIGEGKSLSNSDNAELNKKIREIMSHRDEFIETEKDVVFFIRMQIFSKISQVEEGKRDEILKKVESILLQNLPKNI